MLKNKLFVLVGGLFVVVGFYFLVTEFERTIVSQTSGWVDFFFFLSILSMIVLCWRKRSGKEAEGLYLILITLGLAVGLIAFFAQILLKGIYDGMAMALGTAALFMTLFLIGGGKFDVSAPNTVTVIIETTARILFIVMALLLIAMTAIHTREPKMVWLCCLFLIAVEALIFFYFEIVRQAEKLTEEKETMEES